MQIRASRRQTSAQTGLRPHKVLARHWALQRRLLTGGALALAASVLAWLFGAPLSVHLGLTLVGFGVGFFWRFTAVGRRAERWAFSWIEARAVLSYLTAYELARTDAETDATADPAAGFGEAVRARAAQVGRLETPALQPWALPLVVLALALAALPHLVLPTWQAPLAPLTERLPSAPPDLSAPEETFAAAPEPETGTTPAGAPETGTETGQESSNRTGDSGTDSSDTGTRFDDAAAPSESGAAESERAALENFLEQSGAAQTGASQANQGINQGAPQTGLPQTAPSQTELSQTETSQTGLSQTDTTATSPTGDGGNQAQNERRPSEETGASNTPSDTPSDQGSRAAPGEGSPVGRESAAESEAESAQNSDQAGQETGQKAETPGDADEGAQESLNQNAQPPQAQDSGSQSDSQGASQSGEDAAQNSSASSSNAPRRAAPDAGSQASEDPTDGASSTRAGTRAGGDIDSSRERLGNASPKTPERVTGSRKDGPLSFAGEALRQGDAPDKLPQTGSAAYRRAAEEVVREGRIPLEYQELVRDYFR